MTDEDTPTKKFGKMFRSKREAYDAGFFNGLLSGMKIMSEIIGFMVEEERPTQDPPNGGVDRKPKSRYP